MELARRYLGPPRRGLEIGASTINPFPGLDCWNLDQPSADVFLVAQDHITGRRARVDVFGKGDRLPFRSGSLDYLLSSHVLEHMPDTFRCLREWSRVVRDGGHVFMIVPHRERTFDRDRPRTELAHHLADMALGMSVESSPMVPTSHYHVWVTEDVVRIIEFLNGEGYLDWEITEVEDTDSKVGNGFTIVARKGSQPPDPRPLASGPVAFRLLALDLPFQVPARSIEYVSDGAEFVPSRELPRGRYKAWPITAGFPPRAGRVQIIDVGEPVAPPEIASVGWNGSRLHFRGRHFTPTTYLEGVFPDGASHHVLPEFEDGELVLETEGLLLPTGPLPVCPVNLPPGGGRGPIYVLRAHLEAGRP